FAAHGPSHHAGAGDFFLVRNADANVARDLARDLALDAHGVFLNAVLGHALVGADVDLFLAPDLTADRDLARHGSLHADLLAYRYRAFLVLGAADPLLAGDRL